MDPKKTLNMNNLLLAALMFCCITQVHCQEDENYQPDFSQLDGDKFEKDMVHNRGHIKEHYEGKANLKVDDMEKGELEFVYFREHDYNADGVLDGLELLKAIQHDMPFYTNEERIKSLPYLERKKRLREWHEQWLKQVSSIIDTMFTRDDANNDGYLSFAEFRKRMPTRRN